MLTAKEYKSYDALGLAELVKNKEVSSAELLDTAINLAETVNPQLNALAYKMYDEAKSHSSNIDLSAPFAGVPFLLKDTAMYKGAPLTIGSRFFKDFVPEYDSETVSRYKKAGLIALGKTTMPEFGLKYTTESELFGPCLNPWDLSRSPGGSSGGSAAMVASGVVPMASANDGGGSIRVPASCCGLFGLKPSRGRTSFGPDYGEGWNGLVSELGVSRSVRDSAALLDAIGYPDVGSPYYAPTQDAPYLDEIKREPRKLKIGVVTQLVDNISVDKECRDALEETIALCQSLGHEVIEAKPIFNTAMLADSFHTIVAVCVKMGFDLRSEALGKTLKEGDIESITWQLIQAAKNVSGTDYLKAVTVMHFWARQFMRFFEAHDMLLTPTLAKVPAKIGEINAEGKSLEEYFKTQVNYSPFTPICNQTGQPAMSVPMHWTADNLPIGVHFMGRCGDEATLFQLAAQLEAAKPWIQQYDNLAF